MFDLAVESSGVLERHKAAMAAERSARPKPQRPDVRQRTIDGIPCLKTVKARLRCGCNFFNLDLQTFHSLLVAAKALSPLRSPTCALPRPDSTIPILRSPSAGRWSWCAPARRRPRARLPLLDDQPVDGGDAVSPADHRVDVQFGNLREVGQ